MTPIMVGSRKAMMVHLALPVSFFMVRQVVEQGQWNREKMAMQTAVFTVHPWVVKRDKRAFVSSISTRYPV